MEKDCRKYILFQEVNKRDGFHRMCKRRSFYEVCSTHRPNPPVKFINDQSKFHDIEYVLNEEILFIVFKK